ncbi:MAG: adenylate/guanylate cyclase domain-containing protein [Spirochaetaceae bacterium]|nr:MAG: adenylate/guanylate cyclase domain-containing protein [Spirochaetaceae bacterium]
MADAGFEAEEKGLQRALDFLQTINSVDSACPDAADELRQLSESYRKLLRQSRKLMRISDRLQLQLSEANDALRTENDKNRTLQTIIKQFIPRNTWQKADLNSQNANLEIPNEEVHRTCVFLDVVSFTQFSENRSPEDVIERLNSVFRPIVGMIQEKKGDIDKFIGDSIFAVFDDAAAAITTALKIQQHIFENKLLTLRIGIHSGKVIIGNVGGEDRKDNTYMGDNVNISARLQTHALPGGIMLSEAALEEANLRKIVPQLYAITKTPLYVRGREKPIQVVQIEPKIIQQAAAELVSDE